eukprot:m.136085 g.136085  ORF g.136085 m.136085 type:complete len:156 (-) comp22618_c0_seq19:2548-3015(-)
MLLESPTLPHTRLAATVQVYEKATMSDDPDSDVEVLRLSQDGIKFGNISGKYPFRKIVYRISTKKLSLACDLNDEHHRNSAYEAEFYTSHEPVKVHSDRTGNEPLWFSVPADTFFDEFQQWWQGIAGNELPSKVAFDSEESERDATTVEPAPESV